MAFNAFGAAPAFGGFGAASAPLGAGAFGGVGGFGVPAAPPAAAAPLGFPGFVIPGALPAAAPNAYVGAFGGGVAPAPNAYSLGPSFLPSAVAVAVPVSVHVGRVVEDSTAGSHEVVSREPNFVDLCARVDAEISSLATARDALAADDRAIDLPRELAEVSEALFRTQARVAAARGVASVVQSAGRERLASSTLAARLLSGTADRARALTRGAPAPFPAPLLADFAALAAGAPAGQLLQRLGRAEERASSALTDGHAAARSVSRDARERGDVEELKALVEAVLRLIVDTESAAAAPLTAAVEAMKIRVLDVLADIGTDEVRTPGTGGIRRGGIARHNPWVREEHADADRTRSKERRLLESHQREVRFNLAAEAAAIHAHPIVSAAPAATPAAAAPVVPTWPAFGGFGVPAVAAAPAPVAAFGGFGAPAVAAPAPAAALGGFAGFGVPAAPAAAFGGFSGFGAPSAAAVGGGQKKAGGRR